MRKMRDMTIIMNKTKRTRSVALTFWLVALTNLLVLPSASADLLFFRASLDNQQERFGGTDRHPATGSAFLILDTDRRTYRINMSVRDIFIRDFIDGADRIPDGRAFIDPAAPNYTTAHVHNAEPGVNGPIVIEFAQPPRAALTERRIPAADSNPNPDRTLPISGLRPGGDARPRTTRGGFTVSAEGRIPRDQVQPVNGAEPFGPYVHDLNALGIIREAVAGRLYVNVHASFFEDGELKGQALPNALIRGQFRFVGRRRN